MINQEKVYGNTPCFLNSRKINVKDIDLVDITLYGVPWEGTVTWGDYTGCELGPKLMRICSKRYSGYLPELSHINIFDHLSLGDLGDVPVNPNNTAETMANIEAFADEIWKRGKFSIALGGDHGITYPIVKALGKRTKGKIGVIHLDAHYDNTDDFTGDQFARCSSFARLYEDENVNTECIVHLGIHGPRNTAENGRRAMEAGAKTITIREIRDVNNIKETAKSAFSLASDGTEAVYLSICSDILDCAFNPGGPPDVNGLSTNELLNLIYEITQLGVVGMDFVEVYPQQDANHFSSHLCTTLVLYALAGHIESKKAAAGEALSALI
ncbi:agmatinase family protein [Bacillus halotolerans]|uniref:agmatinase family protein n=1 Tax=Bacillus halotolerans TaxID=260554 RepID=UPI00403F28E9